MIWWYIVSITLSVCFAIVATMFFICHKKYIMIMKTVATETNLQQETYEDLELEENSYFPYIDKCDYLQNVNIDSDIPAIAEYVYQLTEENERYSYKIMDSQNKLLGTGRSYSSKASCVNAALNSQKHFRASHITSIEELEFGKYKVLIEKNLNDEYRFSIVSQINILFISRYFNTNEECLENIEKYRDYLPNKYIFLPIIKSNKRERRISSKYTHL